MRARPDSKFLRDARSGYNRAKVTENAHTAVTQGLVTFSPSSPPGGADGFVQQEWRRTGVCGFGTAGLPFPFGGFKRRPITSTEF